MSEASFPGWYMFIKENFGDLVESLGQLGEVVRKERPLDDKTSHLI
jgi:hypothetical protein